MGMEEVEERRVKVRNAPRDGGSRAEERPTARGSVDPERGQPITRQATSGSSRDTMELLIHS